MKNTIRKMRETKIKFDKDLSKEIFIREINKKIRLILSDDLDASEEKLSDSYCKKIADFIDNFSKWYDKCKDAVKEWGENIYHINIEYDEIKLLNIEYDEIKLLKIFILFEQNECELFGLGFRTEFDIEHGCGIKIKVEDGNYNIVEIGTADIAFC